MAAASDLLVPEGFVLGLLPSASSVPIVKIYKSSSSGTGASSGGASSGVSSYYPLPPAATTTLGVPIGIPDHDHGTDFCEESEEFESDAEWSQEWSSEQLSGEVEWSDEDAVTGSSGEDEEPAEADVPLRLRPEVCVRQRDEALTSCWCLSCAETYCQQQAVLHGRTPEQIRVLIEYWYFGVYS
jgi:hypothetical protein